MPDAIAEAECEEIAAASRQSGVAIAAVSGTYNMIHPDAALRADGLARLATLIRAAPLMGVPLVTLCTGTRHPTDQWAHHPDNAGPAAWHDLIVEMVKAVSLAEECGVDLGIEPELANVVSSPELARRLIDTIGSPRIRIVLDPANLFETASAAETRAIVDGAPSTCSATASSWRMPRIGAPTAVSLPPVPESSTSGISCDSLRGAGFDGPLVAHGLTEAEAPAVAAFLQRVIAEEAAP